MQLETAMVAKRSAAGIASYQQSEIPQQALRAIVEFVEESCTESDLARIVESVIEQLSSYHQRSLSNKEVTNGGLSSLVTGQVTFDKAVEAIASFVEQQEVLASGIVQKLQSFREHLLQLQDQGVASEQQVDLTVTGSLEQDKQLSTNQLKEAIADFLEVEVIESSPLINDLQTLTENLRLHEHNEFVGAMQEQARAISNRSKLPQKVQQRTLDTIAEFVESSSIEEALTGTIESLTKQLSQYQQSIASGSNSLSRLEFLLATRLAFEQASRAIGDYIEQQVVESALAPQALLALAEGLNQLPQAAKTAQQSDVAYQLPTRQVLEALADYVEIQTIESAPLAQNLETLLLQLQQHRTQVDVESVQQLETANADSLAQAEVTVLGLKKLGLQTKQTLEALADYVELEAVELEILPALENKVSELSTSQKGKSLPLVSTSPEPEIFEQATRSITNYLEQAAVGSEITEVLEKLTEELTLIQPEIPTPVEQLDSTISNLLQQLKAISVKEQQVLSAHAVEALANYVELEAVENTLNPQVLQTLSNQMSQGGDLELSAAIQQLERIVGNYQIRLQALTLAQAVGAIADYCELEAVHDAISVDVEQLTSNLSVSSESQLSNQLEQLSESIEQFGKLMKAQQTINPPVINSAPRKPSINIPRVNHDKLEAFKASANSVRDLPLEEVAERLGLKRDRHDKHKWRGVGQVISINDQKFYDHSLQKGGYGAIDLVMHVQGQNFKEAVNWLSNGKLTDI